MTRGKEYIVYDTAQSEFNLTAMKKLTATNTDGVPYNGTNLYLNAIVYDQLKGAANDSRCGGNCFTVNSAYRSCQHQADIRTSGGGQQTAGVGNSPHNKGYAVDINSSKAEFECGNNINKCSIKLVKILADYGFTHINTCITPSGDYYTGTPGKADCVHFSPTGR
jgi:LAS superfamily LD-carboxypeptidase LdcB